MARSHGFAGLRFHDLRHTSATLALQAGVHPKVVSERLGHATIAITLDTYSHVLPDMQRAAADALDSVVGLAPSALGHDQLRPNCGRTESCQRVSGDMRAASTSGPEIQTERFGDRKKLAITSPSELQNLHHGFDSRRGLQYPLPFVAADAAPDR